jgi:hypothetical protein
VFDKNLNVVKNISQSFVRVSASLYHFYAYDSDNNVYVVSPTGYVYACDCRGLTYFSMVGEHLYMNDMGIAYDSDGGVLYIVEPPNDVAVATVTVTKTFYLVKEARETVTVTTYPEVFGVDVASVVVFIGLLLIVVAVFMMLRKRYPS